MTKVKFVNAGLKPLLFGLLLLTAVFSAAAQEIVSQYTRRFQNGVLYYKEARWQEAAAEFRGAQEIAVFADDKTQALYWVILAELALADYGSALMDMDELEKMAPNSSYAKEMVYHRARAYYNQGYFEDAIVLFKRYSDSISSEDAESADRKAAAFFWMGECLFAMGQFEESQRFYAWVISRYPQSPKVDVSSYRIDLIKQKKIEAELLALLRWSHEESLRTSEDYQRKIKTYEHTLNVYQRRIAELQGALGQTENKQADGQAEEITPASGVEESLLERAKRLGLDLNLIIENYMNGSGGVN